MNLVEKALEFATIAHEGQVRKYTGEPYINHPIEVAKIVYSVLHTKAMLCAALLHDVIEDCSVTYDEVVEQFGEEVALLVNWLSDRSKPEDGNRAYRKEIDRIWISVADPQAKTIKLADLISNSRSILQHDKEFAKVYIKEKELLLEVLTEGDATLYAQAMDIVVKAKKELGLE
jgi:(p)ppGpp synthase/HD superfamily hydrolase